MVASQERLSILKCESDSLHQALLAMSWIKVHSHWHKNKNYKTSGKPTFQTGYKTRILSYHVYSLSVIHTALLFPEAQD